jgi:hypothetical protein
VPPLQWDGVTYPDEEPVETPAVIVEADAKTIVEAKTIVGDEIVGDEIVDANNSVETGRGTYQQLYAQAKKLGLTMAQYREQLGLAPVSRGRRRRPPDRAVRLLVPRSIAAGLPVLDAPSLGRRSS